MLTSSRTWLCAVLAVAVGVLVALIPVNARAANSADLCFYGTDVTGDTGLAMRPGTNPVIWDQSNGKAAVAYQSAGGDLAAEGDDGSGASVTSFAMDPKTSPAVSVTNGGTAVAITGSNDQLYVGTGSSMSPTGESVDPGTSPGAASLSSSSAEYDFVNSSGTLTYGSPGSWSTTDSAVDPGSSPALTALNGAGGWEGTFEGSNTDMYALADSGAVTDTGEGMPAGGITSPTITALTNSENYEIGFEANTDEMYFWGSGASAATGSYMASGTYPGIAGTANNNWDMAFHGSNGDLWLYGGPGTIDTGLAMAPGTSPAIAATSSGYEVAYQCTPANAPTTVTTVTQTTPSSTTTTPVTVTTPAPTVTGPTSSRKPRLREKLGFDMTWSGNRSHLIRVTSAVRLPNSAVITVACLRTRLARCPRLGATPTKAKRTVTKELAVVNGRTFAHNVVLRFTVTATGYITEVISVILPGDGPPKTTTTWK